MRSEAELERAITLYSDTVKRLCWIHLKNHADTEDIFQTVFLKYVLHPALFETPEHEKAWIIRVTINACKDLLKSFFRRQTTSLQDISEQVSTTIPEEYSELMEAVLKLPEQYRRVVYLHYYEGYTAPQIGTILHKNVNTVYTMLNLARQMLKQELGGGHSGTAICGSHDTNPG